MEGNANEGQTPAQQRARLELSGKAVVAHNLRTLKQHSRRKAQGLARQKTLSSETTSYSKEKRKFSVVSSEPSTIARSTARVVLSIKESRPPENDLGPSLGFDVNNVNFQGPETSFAECTTADEWKEAIDDINQQEGEKNELEGSELVDEELVMAVKPDEAVAPKVVANFVREYGGTDDDVNEAVCATQSAMGDPTQLNRCLSEVEQRFRPSKVVEQDLNDQSFITTSGMVSAEANGELICTTRDVEEILPVASKLPRQESSMLMHLRSQTGNVRRLGKLFGGVVSRRRRRRKH